MNDSSAQSGADHGLEQPPPFERKMAISWWQGLGMLPLFLVPVLALAKVLGDEMEVRSVRRGDWLLTAELPVCVRASNDVRITLELTRAGDLVPGPPLRVEISPAYLSRFTDVRVISPMVDAGRTSGTVVAPAPVFIDLVPVRYGWARGRVDVTSPTGERWELALKTFVFP